MYCEMSISNAQEILTTVIMLEFVYPSD